MFRCEGKYPQRRSHLALEKYRLDRPNVYNTGGLLPTLVLIYSVSNLFFTHLYTRIISEMDQNG